MQKKPNIIYMLADDMGCGDLTCMNENSKIHTKNLDRLAAGGMIFTDAHSTSAVCTPTRYSILTGRYNWRSTLKKGVLHGYSKPLIEQGRMTAASYLKSRGYKTGCVGKWHLGWSWAKNGGKEADVDFTRPIEDGPASFGFDYYFGISASLDMPPFVYIENDRAVHPPDRVTPGKRDKEIRPKVVWREGLIAPDFRHEEVLPRIAEKAMEFISEHAGGREPFFLYFPLTAPHSPILPGKEFLNSSGTNEYGDFCLEVDSIAGRIMNLLKSKNIDDNTIVIFTSDNGCSPNADFDELAEFGHNPSYVFRGHKGDIYEGGHRIPLIVRWPGVIAPGAVSGETACLVDFLATVAGIFGDSLPDDAGEDSVSSLPVWKGGKIDCSLREATVHHSFYGSFAIRRGQWKLEMCPGSGGWSWPRPGEETGDMPSVQLYNLEKDIGERENVHDRYPGIVKEMESLLVQYIKNGRSTPGAPRHNTGSPFWEELGWMREKTNSA